MSFLIVTFNGSYNISDGIMFIIGLFVIYGLVIGSFCNVVISRLRCGENIITKGSHCTQCHASIRWRDNIPVISYGILRGKCRTCGKHISVQYPFVELLNAMLFGGVGYLFTQGFMDTVYSAIVYAIIFACLSIILVYDFLYMEIPMHVMWCAIALCVAVRCIDAFFGGSFDTVWNNQLFLYGISGLIAFGFFFGLSYYSDETWMGYGDAFIALVMGLLLGPIGTFVALLLAFCVGAVCGVVLMLVQGKTMKTEMPFGPFLIMGLWTVFFLHTIVPDIFSFFV